MRIMVVPDCQVKPGLDTTWLEAIGNYAVAKKPDVIVNIGDFWDFPSLSSYDKGKKSFEGRRYADDVKAGNDAFYRLNEPIYRETNRLIKNKKSIWNPRKVITLGNHCNRLTRAINDDPKLDGAIGFHDLEFLDYEVIPFLQPIIIEGVAFCHYFTTGLAGRPASTAQAQLNKTHMSTISGHQQGLQIATGKRGDGTLLTSVIAGSCYLHDEDYLGQQGNKHWRGLIMLNAVKDGQFDLAAIPLKHIMDKYA